MEETKIGNYIPKVLEEYNNTDLSKPGITHIVISHDDRCSIFKSNICDCDPDVYNMGSDSGQKS